VRFRSLALLLCLLSSLNAFATPRHSHSHRSSFRSYSTRSTGRGRYSRSTTAKNYFKREHLARPWEVLRQLSRIRHDHINPLECGGADAPFNMQWQTIADGKAKDRTERNCRL
jgi:hypothetical protein